MMNNDVQYWGQEDMASLVGPGGSLSTDSHWPHNWYQVWGGQRGLGSLHKQWKGWMKLQVSFLFKLSSWPDMVGADWEQNTSDRQDCGQSLTDKTPDNTNTSNNANEVQEEMYYPCRASRLFPSGSEEWAGSANILNKTLQNGQKLCWFLTLESKANIKYCPILIWNVDIALIKTLS